MNTIILIITLSAKKLIDAEYSVFTEETESSHGARKFKVADIVKVTKYKDSFSKGYTKNRSKEILVNNFVLKTNPWKYEIKNLNRETIMVNFNEKELLLSKL